MSRECYTCDSSINPDHVQRIIQDYKPRNTQEFFDAERREWDNHFYKTLDSVLKYKK